MSSKSYIPISCSFYDELEALATLRQIATIKYAEGDAPTKTAEGKIKNFFIREGVEYLLMDTGLEIRLDHLISVNGKVMGNYC